MADSTDATGPDDAADTDAQRLRRARVEVEARISAVSTRLSLDYGSEATRDGWRDWLAQLRARRDAIVAQLSDQTRH